MDPYRVDADFLGDVRIPGDAAWGAATARALQNSGVGFQRFGDDRELLAGLLQVKQAAALANAELDVLEPAIAQAIVQAASALLIEPAPEQFPLEIVQGGGGTALHMNVNEVLASRATAILGAGPGAVHPNDHVNRGQSTNDVFPTAASVALDRSVGALLPVLERVASALDALAVRYAGVDRIGRSCLMDAVPLPISAAHRAQAHALRRAAKDLDASRRHLLQVPLGGTAVGTGLGAAPGFGETAVARLAELTRRPFTPSEDRYDALASLESVAGVMSAISACARVLARVAGDLRLLAAGPVGGAGEVLLPAVQAGSSIMPGKVNPVIPELVIQTSFRIAGAEHTVRLAAASPELDVTPLGPIAVSETLASARMLSAVTQLFAERCVDGLEWDLDRVGRNLSGSFQADVEYAVDHGYEAAAARRRRPSGRSSS